jgi:hypothetical protein
MKKQLLTIGAVALATFATQQAAQATLVTSGIGNFTSQGYGTIGVGYDVLFDSQSQLYTYLYSFTPIITQPYNAGSIDTFEVNLDPTLVNSVLTAGTTGFAGITLTPTTITATGATDLPDGEIVWSYNPGATTSQLVGFTSADAPGASSGSLIDGTKGPWGDNPPSGSPIPVPVPVPEASTVLAGALMLLPFGIGAIRSLRKERAV